MQRFSFLYPSSALDAQSSRTSPAANYLNS
jgi:hypothetical protein